MTARVSRVSRGLGGAFRRRWRMSGSGGPAGRTTGSCPSDARDASSRCTLCAERSRTAGGSSVTSRSCALPARPPSPWLIWVYGPTSSCSSGHRRSAGAGVAGHPTPRARQAPPAHRASTVPGARRLRPGTGAGARAGSPRSCSTRESRRATSPRVGPLPPRVRPVPRRDRRDRRGRLRRGRVPSAGSCTGARSLIRGLRFRPGLLGWMFACWCRRRPRSMRSVL
ncbi:SLC9A2; solute carrier family 9 (sodium/hydrogen exchanger), member 2 [Parafrankia sp. EUN1f]|nr:SLC9A2; solute carrier family 9 (sodium/hydrogen exchanger), member 2 [Parafrankia sp. EUN1f]